MIPQHRLAARAADESRISKAYGAMTGGAEQQEDQLIEKLEQALEMANEALQALKQAQQQDGQHGEQPDDQVSEDTGSAPRPDQP